MDTNWCILAGRSSNCYHYTLERDYAGYNIFANNALLWGNNVIRLKKQVSRELWKFLFYTHTDCWMQ